jgi:hypothetical protein
LSLYSSSLVFEKAISSAGTVEVTADGRLGEAEIRSDCGDRIGERAYRKVAEKAAGLNKASPPALVG